MITVDGEGAKTLAIGRGVLDGVKDLHVPDVVDVKRLLHAHDQPGAVQLHRKNRLGIVIVAYFRTLFEMADLCGEIDRKYCGIRI